MPSYVITGVSRGIGWEFMRQLCREPNNIVIGIVRNKKSTDERVAHELGASPNITTLEAELTNYDDVKRVAAQAAGITGGRLDYLLANAGQNMSWDAFDPIGVLGESPEELNDYFRMMMNTNVLANIHLYNAFMPQILNGEAKKVVHLTSTLGDAAFARDNDLDLAPVYGMSKSAMNMITAKFAAQYKKSGVLFLGICPGVVDTGQFGNVTAEQMIKLEPMLRAWQKQDPNFGGPISPEASVKDLLSIIQERGVENGDSGAILSYLDAR